VKNRLILVYGKNDYLVKKKVAKILEKKGSSLEKKSFSSREIRREDLELFQSSLFASKRIFLFGEAEKINEGLWRNLKGVVSSLEEDTFIFYSSEMKRNHFLVKEIEELGRVIQVKDSSGEISQLIKEEFERRGKKISPSALKYLLQFSKDLWSLECEVEKITLYYSRKKEISLEDVKDYVSLSPTKSVFDFLDFFLSGKKREAYETLLQVLERSSPISAFYQLSKRLQLLYEVKMLLRLGFKEKKIAGKLELHPFHAQMLLKEEKKIPVEKLESALKKCFEVEKKIKRGESNPRQALLRLVGDF
jgi:DNA polymerase-3 subunit delta